MPSVITKGRVRFRRFKHAYRAINFIKKHSSRLYGVVLRLPKKKHTLYSKAIKLAASQIGTKESPPNSNNVVYNTWYYGSPVSGPEYSWCAVFVSWVLSHSGRATRESYVPHIVALAKDHQDGFSVIPYSDVAKTIKAGIPVLACYDWEHDGTADHVEFVEKVVDSASFQAIGGNTGATNLSNGGEVLRSTRQVSLVQAFVAVQ